MSKHAKQCDSVSPIGGSMIAPYVVRCQKHLRHKNREHQHNNLRWA